MSDDTAVGAHSAYDPPQPTPAEISSAALAGQLRDYLSAPTDSARFNGGVASTTAQTGPGLPTITYHIGGWGYDVPLQR